MIYWDIKEEVDAGDWIGMYLIGKSPLPLLLWVSCCFFLVVSIRVIRANGTNELIQLQLSVVFKFSSALEFLAIILALSFSLVEI